MSFLKKKPSSFDKNHPTESSASIAVDKSDGNETEVSITKNILSSQSMMSLLKKKPTSSDKSQTAEIDSSIAASKSDGTDSDTSVKKMFNSMSFIKKKSASD